MAKFSLRSVVFKLSPKLRQKHSLRDVRSLYDKGAFGEAYAILRDSMQTHPELSDDGDLYILCAELELLVNNDTRRARELLDRAREIGCSSMGYYYQVHAKAMWDKGERKTAIRDLEKSVAADPTVNHLMMLAQALSILDDKRAMNVWEQVLKKSPKNCLAHIYVGREAAKSGDQGKALLMAKRAEKLAPTVRDVVDIGRLYHELGQFQNALNAYLEANRLGDEPKGPLYAAIAACYFSLGEERLARKYAEWAVRSNPEDDYVKEVWKKCEERPGQ